MNILVFTKRVPAAQEEELRLAGDGSSVYLSRIPFKINDWDSYAIEEAVRIVEKIGGETTAITLGNSESDEVLRRSIAMGAKHGLLIEKEDILHDPNARAVLICNFLKKENIQFDAIFTGMQSEDDQFASVGGIMAAKLGLPFASMVIGIDAVELDSFVIRRELEGGLQEKIKISKPCVLSIQSGINEPRYVSIIGVRKADKVERKKYSSKDYEDNLNNTIEVTKWVYPANKAGANMLSGELNVVCKQLLDILKEKGVYK
jgi:electron transfer flavoprotein beta subunit